MAAVLEDVDTTFFRQIKAFVAAEKLDRHPAKEYPARDRTELSNELRDFSKTLELRMPFPPDILGLLRKGPAEQESLWRKIEDQLSEQEAVENESFHRPLAADAASSQAIPTLSPTKLSFAQVCCPYISIA
jgi:hypothetical protein